MIKNKYWEKSGNGSDWGRYGGQTYARMDIKKNDVVMAWINWNFINTW